MSQGNRAGGLLSGAAFSPSIHSILGAFGAPEGGYPNG
jgi:hypothetical protein